MKLLRSIGLSILLLIPLCAMSFVLIFLSDLIERRYGVAVECGVLLVIVLSLLTVVINRDWK